MKPIIKHVGYISFVELSFMVITKFDMSTVYKYDGDFFLLIYVNIYLCKASGYFRTAMIAEKMKILKNSIC